MAMGAWPGQLGRRAAGGAGLAGGGPGARLSRGAGGAGGVEAQCGPAVAGRAQLFEVRLNHGRVVC